MVLNFVLWENAWCGHANIVLVKKIDLICLKTELKNNFIFRFRQHLNYW